MRKERSSLSKYSSLIIEPEILIEKVKRSKSEKFGILGGTFNPPHQGHLIVAEQVKDQLGLDKILFMPTAEPPHSSIQKKTISSDLRVQMLDLALMNNSDFELESYEVGQGGKNYTFNTMKALTDLYPGVEFYFIVGGDMIADLESWYRIEELVELVQFVGIERPGFVAETEYPIIMVDTTITDISSSVIRDKVSKECSIKYLVPTAVKEYIETEGLYRYDNE